MREDKIPVKIEMDMPRNCSECEFLNISCRYITCVAVARNGKFTFPAEIDADMLKKAYENTVKWTLNRLKLESEDK